MELPNNPYFGGLLQDTLLYYPTFTREKYEYNSLIKGELLIFSCLIPIHFGK
jgi:hypothetical protein